MPESRPIEEPTTRVDVGDLMGRPGTSRRVHLAVPPSETLELPLIALREPVAVDLLLESLVNGILARGDVAAELSVSCARCLNDADVEVSTAVVELFADPARADDDDEVEEGYELRDVHTRPHLDLDTLVRDALTEAVPVRALCQEACKGLCASCGTDLNVADCDCADEPVDDRWAALRGLDLPEE